MTSNKTTETKPTCENCYGCDSKENNLKQFSNLNSSHTWTDGEKACSDWKPNCAELPEWIRIMEPSNELMSVIIKLCEEIKRLKADLAKALIDSPVIRQLEADKERIADTANKALFKANEELSAAKQDLAVEIDQGKRDREELVQAKKLLNVAQLHGELENIRSAHRTSFLKAVAFVESKYKGECVRSGSDRPTFPCSICGLIKEMKEEQVR